MRGLGESGSSKAMPEPRCRNLLDLGYVLNKLGLEVEEGSFPPPTYSFFHLFVQHMFLFLFVFGKGVRCSFRRPPKRGPPP